MRDDWRPSIEEIFDYYQARIVAGRGQWQKATCPLSSHNDTTPSASVNVEAGKWQCWACDMRGDGLDIVKENEGLAGFAECLRFAKEHFGGGDSGFRAEPVRRGGLSTRSRNQRGGSSFVPPWSGL